MLSYLESDSAVTVQKVALNHKEQSNQIRLNGSFWDVCSPEISGAQSPKIQHADDSNLSVKSSLQHLALTI